MAVRLGELATRFGCDLNGDPDTAVEGIASLTSAGPTSLCFLSNSKLKPQLSSTKAAAVVLRAEDAADAPTATLITDNPHAAFARMANLLHPLPATVPGVHATAVVDPSASVDTTAQVDAHTVIAAGARIDANVIVGAGSFVGPNCQVGADTRLHPKVTLVRDVILGRRCILHSGVVIGADGFGNAMTPDGWVKVPQVGGVRIGDDVEVGANSTIDCGAIGDTVIEDGVRIDNLCMIGHNAHIGAHTAMAAMVGIAGSAIVGKRCMFAGMSGTVGHIRICDDVVVSGQGMVSKPITEPGVYASSFPVDTARNWNRFVARLRRVGGLFDRVSKLEKDRK